MKQLFLGLALTLTSALSFACTIIGIGDCSGKSYFITHNFNPNSIYKFWVTGTSDTLLTFTTGANVSDSIFSLPVDAGASIEMAYNYIGSDFIEHYNPAIAANYEYAGCGALPVRISNFYVQKKSDSTLFTFNAGSESGIKYYNIKGSVNGKDFVMIDKINATGANHYSLIVPNKRVLAVVITAFIFLAFKEDRKRFINKHKGWIGLILIAIVIFLFSCKKEDITPAPTTSEYKIFKVEAVDFSDKVTETQTTTP